MRGFDCSHPAHDDIHISGANDEELVLNALAHRDRYHPEFSDDQIREIVTASAQDEEP